MIEQKAKLFCFRCGEEPFYQVEIHFREGERGKRGGPVYPLCEKCVLEIPWATVFRGVIDSDKKYRTGEEQP